MAKRFTEDSPYPKDSPHVRDMADGEDVRGRNGKNQYPQTTSATRTNDTLDIEYYDCLVREPSTCPRVDITYERNRRRYIKPSDTPGNKLVGVGRNMAEDVLGDRTFNYIGSVWTKAKDGASKLWDLNSTNALPPVSMPPLNVMSLDEKKRPRQYKTAEGKWNAPRKSVNDATADNKENARPRRISRVPLKGLSGGLVEVSDSTDDEKSSALFRPGNILRN